VHFRDRGSGDCPGFGKNAAFTEGKPKEKPKYGYPEDGPSSEVYGPLGWESAYGGRKPVGKFIGWVDDLFFYLDKDAAYAAVQEYSRRGDIPFGIKPRALWEALAKKEISVTQDGRIDTPARVGGKQKRVVQIPRIAVDDVE
jgi:hypothetical protein